LAHLGVVHKIIGSGTDINGNAQKEAWEKMMAYSFLEQQHFHSSRIKRGLGENDGLFIPGAATFSFKQDQYPKNWKKQFRCNAHD